MVYLPEDINNETVVANVTVTGLLASLVRPFVFYIDKVTQRQQSREGSKRTKRSVKVNGNSTVVIDACYKAGFVKPENYFCIHRLTGRIKVTQDFVFKNGEEFDLNIRVTDSDHWGKTQNTATFKIISGDPCGNVRAIYEEVVKYCNQNSSADGQKWCLSKQCKDVLQNWQEAFTNASKVSQKNCFVTPPNLAAVMGEYPRCTGGTGKSRAFFKFELSPKLFVSQGPLSPRL